MPFTIKEQNDLQHPSEKIFQASVKAIEELGGKLKKDEASGTIKAQLDKTILGKVVGERTQLTLKIKGLTQGQTSCDLEAYPLDAIGRKLMFGARKGVTRTVVDLFFKHLNNQL